MSLLELTEGPIRPEVGCTRVSKSEVRGKREPLVVLHLFRSLGCCVHTLERPPKSIYRIGEGDLMRLLINERDIREAGQALGNVRPWRPCRASY
jgi:hypothetical protein